MTMAPQTTSVCHSWTEGLRIVRRKNIVLLAHRLSMRIRASPLISLLSPLSIKSNRSCPVSPTGLKRSDEMIETTVNARVTLSSSDLIRLQNTWYCNKPIIGCSTGGTRGVLAELVSRAGLNLCILRKPWRRRSRTCNPWYIRSHILSTFVDFCCVAGKVLSELTYGRDQNKSLPWKLATNKFKL